MRIVVCALAALSLTACASGPMEPYAHSLSEAQIARMGPTPVSVTDNNHGLVSTWPMQDSSGAAASQMVSGSPAGLVGGLLVMGIDAMMNSEPQRRAIETADEVETVFTAEALNAAMEETFRRLAADAPAGSVAVSDVSRSLKVNRPGMIHDAIEIVTVYQMADYSNGIRISSLVTYQDSAGGGVYNNMFTYYSPELQAPELTQDVRVALIAAINGRARRETGELPRNGTTAHVDYTRDVREARDDFLTRAEKAILVTEEWMRNDGALLRAEIETAHALIARYVLLDLNRPTNPGAAPRELVIETLADGRTVNRHPTGFLAGTYEFTPASGPQRRSTYSTGIGVSAHQQARMRWLLETAAAGGARPAR